MAEAEGMAEKTGGGSGVFPVYGADKFDEDPWGFRPGGPGNRLLPGGCRSV